MNYLPLALITMALLGVHYFLVKLISPHIASPAIALAGSIVFVPTLFAYLYFTKTPIIPEQKIYFGYAILVGVPLAIAILTLYLAIAKGPMSVVMPIYGLNAMIAVLLGILILHEPLSTARVAGIAMAVSAIILLSR